MTGIFCCRDGSQDSNSFAEARPRGLRLLGRLVACSAWIAVFLGGGSQAFAVIEDRLNDAPAGMPFELSTDFVEFGLTGRYANYANADTWYPTWAADGHLYSPWTDGTLAGQTSRSNSVNNTRNAQTGQAKIVGDDPLNLAIENLGITVGNPASGYEGRYPAGSLHYDGVWYYGTYNLHDTNGSPGVGLNWDVLGPFAGFRTSTDNGQTWSAQSSGDSLFPEPASTRGAVKFGAPHFVDFGQNMEHSPDGKAYLVGHGSRETDPSPRPGGANASWVTGDEIYLSRVTPSISTINDESQYEYFAGRDTGGEAIWSYEYADIEPLVDWNNHAGNVSVTYNAPLDKYLMFVTDGADTVDSFDTYVLEADDVAGPFRLVSYREHFGEQAYFVNAPSKFTSDDGQTMWMIYSNDFNTPNPVNIPGSEYGFSIHEFRLFTPEEREMVSKVQSAADLDLEGDFQYAFDFGRPSGSTTLGDATFEAVGAAGIAGKVSLSGSLYTFSVDRTNLAGAATVEDAMLEAISDGEVWANAAIEDAMSITLHDLAANQTYKAQFLFNERAFGGMQLGARVFNLFFGDEMIVINLDVTDETGGWPAGAGGPDSSLLVTHYFTTDSSRSDVTYRLESVTSNPFISGLTLEAVAPLTGTSVVPEPATWVLVLLGVACWWLRGLRR